MHMHTHTHTYIYTHSHTYTHSYTHIVWRSRPSQEEEGLVKCLYGACVSGMQLATTLWSKSATFHVQLGVLSSTVNRACVSASLGSSVHVVVSLRKPTTDTYLWGRPDSGSLPRARYRHLTRPSSSCEGRLRQTNTHTHTSSLP